MSGPPRDWDKEMAEIDKMIAKQPAPAPGVRGAPAALPSPQRAGPVAPSRTGHDVLATWVRVLLGVTVAAGVGFAWPYAHACGLPLYGYLVAAGGVALAGLWGAVTSWSRRVGLAHIVSLLVALVGAALLGKAILERTEYAKQPATWTCP